MLFHISIRIITVSAFCIPRLLYHKMHFLQVFVGTLAVDRRLRQPKMHLISLAPRYESHDFPMGADYKITPSGYMPLIPKTEEPVFFTDQHGQERLKLPSTGPLLIVNRAQAFHSATIESHLEDLSRIIPRHRLLLQTIITFIKKT